MLKHYLSVVLLATTLAVLAQHPCSVGKIHSHQQAHKAPAAKTASATPPMENDYDVKFYHLDLNAENNTLVLSGHVRCLAQVVVASMDTFACVLHTNHTVDSVYVNGTRCNFTRQDSLLKTGVGAPIAQNQMVDATVYYHGTCPSGGNAAIGNGYNNDTSPSWGNYVSWTLSESFVAYEWFPCKQDLTDRIDSSWVFVTTDSSNMVGSNGLLQNVVTNGSKKRYEWKSRHQIDYYLISISVAKYKPYVLYAHPQYLHNDSVMVLNYVYDNAINNAGWISGQKVALDKITTNIELYSRLYGMYPFYKEKYGHCMAPLSGGMEHQTMTTLGYFDFTLDAHELAHQWWGDNVTCKAWKDIWMNEGWASYNEYISNQYLTSQATADNNMLQAHNSVMSQTGGSIYFTNADTMNSGRIFDSRLTYDKGGAIIHSIRFELNNDTVFFNTCRDFLNTYSPAGVASVPDFINYFNAHSGHNFTQFFNQWYYGEGYPTFNVKWNQVGQNFYMTSVQTTSMPSSVSLFITPLEYKLQRTGGYGDTIVRLMHGQSTENYFLSIPGTVTNVVVDPNNWIINKVIGPVKDATLTGLNDLASAQPDVFIGPNPTSDVLHVNLYTNDKAKVEIYDMGGRLVKQFAIEGQASTDLSAFTNGIYTVSVKSTNGSLLRSVKVVKE